MTTTRLFRPAALVLLAVLATGCSGATADQGSDGAGKRPEIPSLTTPTPGSHPSSKAAPDPNADRPRERLDMTDADRTRLYQPYTDCMRNNGVDLSRRASGPTTDPAKAKNAGKVCDSKLPLPAWEIDANNPDALDFGRKVVQCLKGKGVKYVELSTSDDDGIVGPSFGGKNNDQESISKGLALTPECEREVAGR